VRIELSPTVVADALARLGERDLEAPPDVAGALAWIAGREDAEAPMVVSRYDLQASSGMSFLASGSSSR
jgi:hypothetical protein